MSCPSYSCLITVSFPVHFFNISADVISDLALVLLPIYFLRRAKINHRQRIMIFSAFSASLLITVVTILHSAALFTVRSSGTVVIGHVKVSHTQTVILVLGWQRDCKYKRRTSKQISFPWWPWHVPQGWNTAVIFVSFLFIILSVCV